MKVEEYCLSNLAATKNYPFGDQVVVFKVVGKIFALTSPPGRPTSISPKCDPVLAVSLRQKYLAITPGYHLNKTHWNSVQLNGTVSDPQIAKMISHSYERALTGIPKSGRPALKHQK